MLELVESWTLLENIGAFFNMLELVGECWSLLENVGAFWRKLELLGEPTTR